MARRILYQGEDTQVASVEEKPKRKLKKRGHPVAKAIVGIILVLAIVGGLVAGVLIGGNYAFEQAFGVSVWDTFSTLDDIKVDNSQKIITNSFDSDSDLDKFYNKLNKSFYLKENANTKTAVNNILTSLLGGKDFQTSNGVSGESVTAIDEALSLFSNDNIDKAKLSSYKGWNDDSNYIDDAEQFTDRELAAFLEQIIFKALDSATDNVIPFGLKLNELLDINQVIISAGNNFSSEDKTAFKISDGKTYVKLTASVKLIDMIKGIMGDMGINGIDWVFGIFLPKNAYLTAVMDMTDKNAETAFELNYMRHENVEFGFSGEEKRTMTKMDKFVSIVNRIVHKTGNTSFDIEKVISDVLSSVKMYIVEDKTASFSLGNVIALSTVEKETDGTGNVFKIDLLSTVIDMLGGTVPLASSEIVTIMQGIICADNDRVLADALGASVKASAENAENTSKQLNSATTYNDAFDASALDLSLLEGYSAEFIAELADAYNISPTYVDSVSGETKDYTIDQITDAVLGTDLVEGSPAYILKSQMEDVVNALVNDEKIMLGVTDKMLCSLFDKTLNTLVNEPTLNDYSFEFKKIGLNDTNVDGVKHSVVSIYGAMDLSKISGLDKSLGDFVGSMLGGSYVLIQFDIDISSNITESTRLAPQLILNGLDGNANYLNGLTTKVFLDAINKLTNFDEQAILETVESSILDATNGLKSDSKIELVFKASTAETK